MPFRWRAPGPGCAHRYLLPHVVSLVDHVAQGRRLSIADLGCGNGYVTAELARRGHHVIGIDASPDGIAIARAAYPNMDFRVASVYEEGLLRDVGPVDCVVSVEVIEHLIYPRVLLQTAHDLLKPRGCLILTTPYHGYLKNLAVSILNGWDRHFGVAWEGGHIKFFSRRTLRQMALNVGFAPPRFHGAGRVPWLWKSIVMATHKGQ